MEGFSSGCRPSYQRSTRSSTSIQQTHCLARSVDFLPKIRRMVYETQRLHDRQTTRREYYEAFYTTSNMATKRMQLPKWMLFRPISPGFYSARTKHFGMYEQMVREARQTINSDANDMLHVYLRKGPTVSDQQIALFLGNVPAGGVFSAGTAIVNTLYFLARHPQVAEKLPSELTVSTESIYLDQVMHESLRTYRPCRCSSATCSRPNRRS